MLFRCLISSVIIATLTACQSIKYDEKEADMLVKSGQIEQAKAHYTYLANFGLSSAQYKLGKMYALEGDEPQAIHWLDKAKSAGNDRARLSLARLYAFSENSTPTQQHNAYKEFVSLAKQGNDKAIKDIAKMYQVGILQKLDNEDLSYFTAKANQGDIYSCYMMAKLTEQEDSSLFDTNLANKYFQCATKSYYLAIYDYAMFLDKYPQYGDITTIIQTLSNFEDDKANKIAFKIAATIERSQLVTWRDQQAETLYLHITQSDSEAFFRLAKLYINKPLLGKDKDDILDTINQGKAQNNINCFALEAQMYLFGEKVIQDPWKAEEKLLNISTETPYVSYLLGYLYTSGYLGEPHLPKGIAYLESAAQDGYKRADKLLAKIYFEGRGIQADKVRALTHLLLSMPNEDSLPSYRQKFLFNEQDLVEARKHKVETQQVRMLSSQGDVSS